ncbi:MAG: M23 family metallopeptidase, partial [Myxococcales bacterium]|nr:M23 family metallopeptidase [Myxococcales bacterium]
MAARVGRIQGFHHRALIALAAALCAPGFAGAAPPLVYPLGRAPQVSGTFGTYRIGHHHAGMDLTTDDDESVPVLAAADGEIYRIRRDHVGYGRAIYIAHPDGRHTVYGHLSAFAPRLLPAVRAAEKRAGDYPFDQRLSPRIAVKAGEPLGLVGTAGTDLVHLHFEVRRGGQPVNPLTNGLKLPDTRPPALKRLLAVPLTPGAHVDGSLDESYFAFGEGRLPRPIRLSGDVQLFVEAIDLIDGGDRALTPYEIELRIDGKRWHHVRYERVSYREKAMTELDFHPRLRAAGEGMFHALRGPDTERVSQQLVPGKPLSALRRGKHEAVLRVLDAAGLSAEVRFTLQVEADTPPCPFKRKPLKVGPALAPPLPALLRGTLLAIAVPGACESEGLTLDVRVDDKRTGDFVWTRLDGQPAIALTVPAEAPARVLVGHARGGAPTWYQVETQGAPADKEQVFGPAQLTVGEEARFAPYPTLLRAPLDPVRTPALEPVGPRYALANAWAPTRGGSTIGLRVPGDAPEDRLGLYLIDGDHWWWCGASRRGPWLRGWTVHLGEFAIMRDTVAPTIGRAELDHHPGGRRVVVPVDDGGSGIASVRMTVDGQPVYAEWQRAFARLIWRPLDALVPGTRAVAVIAIDRAGNETQRREWVEWPAPPEQLPDGGL